MNKTKLIEKHGRDVMSCFSNLVHFPTQCDVPDGDSPSFSLNTQRDELLFPHELFQGHLSPFTVPCVCQVTLVQGRMLYWSARAVIANTTDWGHVTHTNLFSHSFGGWKPKIKASAGLVYRRLSSWLADATLLLPVYVVIPLGITLISLPLLETLVLLD